MINLNFIPGFPDFKRIKFGTNNNLVAKVLTFGKNKSRGNGDPRKHQIFPLNMRKK